MALIELEAAEKIIRERSAMLAADGNRMFAVAMVAACDILKEIPTIDAVPCKIGDVVYGIRNYKGKTTIQKGFVSEMFFTKDMKLMIVVKHVCRGYWGEKVFPTYEAAEAAKRKGGDG